MRKPSKQMIREAKRCRDFAETMALWDWAGNNYVTREHAAAIPECNEYMKRWGEKAYNDTLASLDKDRGK